MELQPFVMVWTSVIPLLFESPAPHLLLFPPATLSMLFSLLVVLRTFLFLASMYFPHNLSHFLTSLSYFVSLSKDWWGKCLQQDKMFVTVCGLIALALTLPSTAL